MLIRIIISILILASGINLHAQAAFEKKLIPDSTIAKLKIKKVTEDGYGNAQLSQPYWTTIEMYDSLGRKIHKTSINHTYNKFVYDITYDEKKNVKRVTEKYYDWNPYREKNKKDTILKTTVETYPIIPAAEKKGGTNIDNLPPKLTYDSLGRVIQQIDTIKCGYEIVKYTFDNRGKVIEQRHYITHHNEPPLLEAIDSLMYNEKGLLIKEVNYSSIKELPGKIEYDRVSEKIFQYDSNGLLKEMLTNSYSLSVPDSKLHPVLYKYTYEFFD